MTRTSARQGSPRTKWYLLLFIFICAAIVWFLNNDNDEALPPEQPSTDIHRLEPTATQAAVHEEPDIPEDPDDFTFVYCENLIADTHSASRDWARANYQDWERYLEQGYSLDEVTLAVDYFTNPNFAGRFRASQLRKNSDLGRELTLQEEELARHIPEYKSYGLSITPRIPAPPLEGLFEKSPLERGAIIEEHGVTANDAAYFVSQRERTDNDILWLLKHVADPSAVIHYSGLEIVSLLDYAIAYGRPDIVEVLLNAGLRPTADGYLGSSMEWAINGIGRDEESRKRSARIISMLLPLNAEARFTTQNEKRIRGNFPRGSYRLDEEAISAMHREYGIDLTRIPSREVPSITPDHPLIRELETQRSEHINAQTIAHHLDRDIVACEALVETVKQAWQPRDMLQVMNSVIAEFPDDPERIKSELAQIDPKLVDTFRERHEARKQRFSPVKIPVEMTTLLNEGKINEVIDFYLGQELTDGNINSLMWDILSWDHRHYEALSNSGLLRHPLEYADLEVFSRALSADAIEQLEHAGADMRGADSLQKTVLFYAVKRARPELVTFLEQRGYPFSFDDMGQDPLHAALDTSNYRLSIDLVEKLVPLLMQYRPFIDQFHLSRMAVIQLKYPQTYQRLVSQYPQLEVTPDTELPQVR